MLSAAMKHSGIQGERLIAVFLLGCLLFNYPLLFLFNSDHRIFGIPLLYVYIFTAWALVIALIARVADRNSD